MRPTEIINLVRYIQILEDTLRKIDCQLEMAQDNLDEIQHEFNKEDIQFQKIGCVYELLDNLRHDILKAKQPIYQSMEE